MYVRLLYQLQGCAKFIMQMNCRWNCGQGAANDDPFRRVTRTTSLHGECRFYIVDACFIYAFFSSPSMSLFEFPHRPQAFAAASRASRSTDTQEAICDAKCAREIVPRVWIMEKVQAGGSWRR